MWFPDAQTHSHAVILKKHYSRAYQDYHQIITPNILENIYHGFLNCYARCPPPKRAVSHANIVLSFHQNNGIRSRVEGSPCHNGGVTDLNKAWISVVKFPFSWKMIRDKWTRIDKKKQQETIWTRKQAFRRFNYGLPLTFNRLAWQIACLMQNPSFVVDKRRLLSTTVLLVLKEHQYNFLTSPHFFIRLLHFLPLRNFVYVIKTSRLVILPYMTRKQPFKVDEIKPMQQDRFSKRELCSRFSISASGVFFFCLCLFCVSLWVTTSGIPAGYAQKRKWKLQTPSCLSCFIITLCMKLLTNKQLFGLITGKQ